MKTFIVLLLAAVLVGCGYTPRKEDAAQVGDTVSTAIAIESGNGQEANPLVRPLTDAGAVGYVALLAIKLGINYKIRQLDPETCRVGMRLTTTSGWGLFGNNLAVAAKVAGGAAIPVGITVAAVHWYVTRDSDLGCAARTGEPLTDAQILLLAKWRKAYTERDADAVRALLDNPRLADKYTEWFEKLEGVEVEYSGAERTEEGFTADYEAVWRYKDGEVKKREGVVEWTLRGDRLVDVR